MDKMEQKRNHTFYITNQAIAWADEISETLGISRAQVMEMSLRAMHNARSAHTYQIAYDEALADVKRELGISPSDSTE
jgi:hypothetical protein